MKKEVKVLLGIGLAIGVYFLWQNSKSDTDDKKVKPKVKPKENKEEELNANGRKGKYMCRKQGVTYYSNVPCFKSNPPQSW